MAGLVHFEDGNASSGRRGHLAESGGDSADVCVLNNWEHDFSLD
jgi:hypothetical protein